MAGGSYFFSGFVRGTSLAFVGYQIPLRLFWFSGLNVRADRVCFTAVHEEYLGVVTLTD